VDTQNFPKDLIITSQDDLGFIMSLEHVSYDVKGVQFHPESVLTPKGATILSNWLKN
jgi:anthranilate synthase component 2